MEKMCPGIYPGNCENILSKMKVNSTDNDILVHRPRFLVVNGNSVNLLQKVDLDVGSKLREKILLHCDSPHWNNLSRISSHSEAVSKLLLNQDDLLPSISSRHEKHTATGSIFQYPEHKSKQLRVSDALEHSQYVHRINNFFNNSLSREKNSLFIPLSRNLSGDMKLFYEHNETKNVISDGTADVQPESSPPLLRIKTVNFNGAKHLRHKTLVTNINSSATATPRAPNCDSPTSISSARSVIKAAVSGTSCDLLKRKVLHADEVAEPSKELKQKLKHSIEESKPSGTLALFIAQNQITPQPDKTNPPESAILAPKTNTVPSTLNTGASIFQKLELNKSLYWQFDRDRCPKTIKKSTTVDRKKPLLAQPPKKSPLNKASKFRADAEKPGLDRPDEMNVEKLIDAVSFQRWNNNFKVCESDCQLLAERVKDGASLIVAHDDRNKVSKKDKNSGKSSRSCISLLLEAYKERKQKEPRKYEPSKTKRKCKRISGKGRKLKAKKPQAT